MALLKWIIALPFIVGAVLFALEHPQKVPVTFNPFSDPIELPLYFVALMFLATGFLLGAFMAWLGMGKIRKDRRQYKKDIKTLTKENEKLIQEKNELLGQVNANQSSEIIQGN